MRLVLFDCDGTLADSFGVICETMRRAFLAEGLPAPDERATRGIIGLSLGEAVQRLSPTSEAGEVRAIVEAYKRTYQAFRAEQDFEEPLFSGVDAMLRDLASREAVLVGMVTGKSRRGVRHILEAHRLEDVFHAVRTADDCPSKPHPAMVLECCAELGIEPRQTIVVGDAIFDIEMAIAGGAAALGVTWGAETPERLLFAGARAVVPDVAALRAHLDDWLATGADPSPLLIAS